MGDDSEDVVRAALYGLLMAQGGHAVISAEQLPYRDFQIAYRRLEGGNLEIRIFDKGTLQ